jgi:aromatic ring hydroxylase
MGDHGRIIPLSKDPHEPARHIEAYTGYNALLFESTEEAAKEHLKWIRDDKENSRVTVSKQLKTTLGGLKAERLVVRYYSKKVRAWIVEDRIDALDGNMEYALYLRTREANYPQDRTVFESVVSSWKHIPADG